MKNTKNIILLICSVMACSLLVVAGCGQLEGEDPAEAMARQSQQSAPPSPTAAADNAQTPSGSGQPAMEDETAAEGEDAATGDEGAAAEGEEDAATGDEGAAAEGEGAAADDEEAATEGEEGAADEEGAAVESGQEPATDDEAAGTEGEEPGAELTADERAEEVLEGDLPDQEFEAPEPPEVDEEEQDPIKQFKSLDPRDIIDRKYEDLQEQHTEPWNEEDPEEFIPETGRVDPLTPVFESIPDELRPPRTGDTDQNEINSYFIARDATLIAYALAYSMQCYSVLEIGIDKYASVEVAGNRFTIQEGQSVGPFGVGQSNGIPLVASLYCSSISTSQVVINITVSGQGTSTSISKTQVFIPDSWQ